MLFFAKFNGILSVFSFSIVFHIFILLNLSKISISTIGAGCSSSSSSFINISSFGIIDFVSFDSLKYSEFILLIVLGIPYLQLQIEQFIKNFFISLLQQGNKKIIAIILSH